ncbi:MAG TPA: response regulator [Humidesulfovibrio sp.]|uniref:response regulator n=1 Tax=Humidesulfovibrio sp. TaxID=2910988 RepID=UPI002C7AF288|nr:response regulator [Humidesulfovibrio sp.]HWR03801.1 response regulator [Humidesulfovibrio sp.]
MQHTILILDDEARICETLVDYLVDCGHIVFAYQDVTAAMDALGAHNFTTAIVDIRLPDTGGYAFIERASHIRPELRYIIHTGSLDFANGGLRHGEDDRIEAVLIKPLNRLQDFSDILERMGRAR